MNTTIFFMVVVESKYAVRDYSDKMVQVGKWIMI